MRESLQETKQQRESSKNIVAPPTDLRMISHHLPGFASQLNHVAADDVIETETREPVR